MAPVAGGPLGRPTASSREDVLALATQLFLEERRVEMQAVARRLGLARATVYRWFGTREALLGEMIASLGEHRLAAHRRACTGTGARVLVESLYSYNQELLSSGALRALLEREQERALRILTSSDGIVEPRLVAAVERMVDAEVKAGYFDPPVATETLAFAVVKLGEAFIYQDAAIGSRGDIASLREVHAALLGVGADAPLRSAGRLR